MDDFAIKKGEKYATGMIDINTHKIIDIIDSRDHDKVTSWLRKFPNLQIVSRDGSIAYKKAITDSHRFHLLKNLTTYCKNFLTKYLNHKIKIELAANNLNNNITSSYELFSKQPLKERYQYAMKLYHNSVNKSTCCKLFNIDIRLFNKLLSLNDNAKLEYFKTKKEILHNQKVVEKEEKIKLVREMHKAGYSIRAISRELHMARETVSKYLKPDVSAVHACYGIKKDGGILLPYKDKINEYFSKRF
ncbi:MAG: transposase, partial [Sarcina sp.]